MYKSKFVPICRFAYYIKIMRYIFKIAHNLKTNALIFFKYNSNTINSHCVNISYDVKANRQQEYFPVQVVVSRFLTTHT